jgi:hypothetical protein
MKPIWACATERKRDDACSRGSASTSGASVAISYIRRRESAAGPRLAIDGWRLTPRASGRQRGRCGTRPWPDGCEGAPAVANGRMRAPLSNSGSTLFAFYGEPRGRAGTGSQMSRRFVSPEGWGGVAEVLRLIAVRSRAASALWCDRPSFGLSAWVNITIWVICQGGEGRKGRCEGLPPRAPRTSSGDRVVAPKWCASALHLRHLRRRRH